MKKLLILIAALLPASVQSACEAGAYKSGDGDILVVVPAPNIPSPGQRYLFIDGRRGTTVDADGPVRCVDGKAEVKIADAKPKGWARIETTETATSFDSYSTKLAGKLIEPIGGDAKRPLVIMVHGSERTSALNSPYAYMLAAQGISVFVYDKRGTGASEGDYTQNFELLASDAQAALAEAQRLAAGRYGRSGYFGGSQGGWVAPLAASRSNADFVAVGFGLVASPIEEDRDQMLGEARELGLDPEDVALINQLSRASAILVTSHFERGYKEMAAIKRKIMGKPWAAKIKGEYSGDMLLMSEQDLRLVGRARFDNLELIWNYDSVAALKKLNKPLLWVLAGEDREAPIAGTRKALTSLIAVGKDVDLYLFPQTDHGMVEFTTGADGSRHYTRITNGYLRLLGDWIKGETKGPYGRAERLD